MVKLTLSDSSIIVLEETNILCGSSPGEPKVHLLEIKNWPHPEIVSIISKFLKENISFYIKGNPKKIYLSSAITKVSTKES